MWSIKGWVLSHWGRSPEKRPGSLRSDARTYFPSLDGWRALSVIAVILYHGRFDFFSDDSLLRRISAHGEIGVDVFFAISGFLITSLLLQEFRRTDRISLRSFYLRRFFRIIPAYYLAIATISILGVVKLIPMDLKDLLSCLLFYRNYRPLGMDVSGGFYTAHFWSLAIEEHFYILWPALILLVRPRRIGPVALVFAVAVFGWRELEMHYHLSAALFSQQDLSVRTDTRIDSLLWACIAAIYYPAIERFFESIPISEVWLPFAAIVAGVVAFRIRGSELIIAIVVPLMVLGTVAKPNSILGQILESAPLCWIGTLSYSIYLWQELFLPEISSMKGHGAVGFLQHEPWSIIAILTCACLSNYLLERPMNRLGHRLSTLLQRRAEGTRVFAGRMAL
jgi:peptidoglycan/LPS O-acetylase OafA/YrhL